MCPPPRPPPPAAAPPQQPPPYPYPYYDHNHYRRSKPSSSSSCASCLLATLFLTAVLAAGLVTCYILFRPLDPQISVTLLKFPSFSLSPNRTAANFTFFQYVAVRNPNRYEFSHYDSSIQLASPATGPVGSVYIPAGKIAPGRTQYLSATFDVREFPIPPPGVGQGMAAEEVGEGMAAMEVGTRMRMVGTVKVLKVFAHHVEKQETCRVTVRVSDGAVLAYNC